MSLIQELINGASGDASVTSLLRKVKVVAARAEVPALDEWVQHELDGYPDGAELPEYRGPFQTEVIGHFGGPFGSGMRNAPIPSALLPEEFRAGMLFNISFSQPIAELEELTQGDGVLQSPWPANAIAYVNGLILSGKIEIYGDMGLLQAWRQVSKPQIVAIIDAVRNRILDLALTMEKSYPETGQPDAPPLPTEAQQLIVTNIYGTSNVAVASSDFNQFIDLEPGDREALAKVLDSVGVPDEEIQALFEALESDGEVESEVGPSTKRWLGNLMTRATDLGIGAAGGVIAEAVARYLGIG